MTVDVLLLHNLDNSMQHTLMLVSIHALRSIFSRCESHFYGYVHPKAPVKVLRQLLVLRCMQTRQPTRL
jgi:hypothetical protein